MATGTKMAFNYYQSGKYGTLPQNPQKDMEVTQDMHLKMSKKIAQLTKVIYALNTKNDEHDAILQSVRDQHEGQMQQLLHETKEKIAYYKSRIQGELEQKRRIASLEQCVLEHEKQKKEALAEFQAYKKRMEEQELQLKTENSQKLIAVSKEVLDMKRVFEKKLQAFDSLKDQYVSDRDTALEQLREQHKREMEDLLRAQQSQHGELSEAQKQLEESYKSQIAQLKEKNELLDSEKKQIGEEYELKLSKAQAFYEKELAVLRDSQNATFEEQVIALQNELDKTRKDLTFQEGQFKKRVEDLLSQLSVSEEEVNKYKDELQRLQQGLQSKDSDSAQMEKQLWEAKQEVAKTLTNLREVEAELAASKERCKQQAADLLRKSTQLGELEATKIQHECTIKDLTAELAKLRDRLGWLEDERKSLKDQSQSSAAEQTKKMLALEKALEDLSVEKQTLKERYERDLKDLRESSGKEVETLKASHQSSIEDLKSKHKRDSETQHKENEERLSQLRKALAEELEATKLKLSGDKESVVAQYERKQAELTSKLQQSEEEVKRLEKLIQDREAGLGSATSNLNSLKDACNRLKAELDSTRADLRSSKNHATNLQAELQRLKLQHESKMKESQIELKTKLEQLSKDLDAKWTETLRKECMKLRQELTAQKEEDKRAALRELSRLKEDEMAAAKKGWETRVTDLLHQISMLKMSMDAKDQTSTEELERLKNEAAAENKRLMAEMLKAADEYAQKIEAMERMHQGQLEKLEVKKNQEAEAQAEELQKKHIEDMQSQMVAHKSTLEMVRDQTEKQRLTDLEELKRKQRTEQESLREEMKTKSQLEMEQLSRAHQTQMQAARMELQRAMDLSKQKDSEHQSRVQDLEEEIQHRERHIRNLEDEIRRLQVGVNDLSRELEAKGKEILKVRSEANQTMRHREDELNQAHEDEISSLKDVQQREAEQLLTEFNRAQEMLKDKISALQIMLEEAEDRYRNRESREEDLEAIAQLQDAVKEREEAMKKLIDDKRYFQMELINRETNFNKVFSTSPQVGVLNPLSKKGKGEKGPTKYTSSPTLNSFGGPNNRLNPMPGSPQYEGLNRNKLLPPPTKKYLK